MDKEKNNSDNSGRGEKRENAPHRDIYREIKNIKWTYRKILFVDLLLNLFLVFIVAFLVMSIAGVEFMLSVYVSVAAAFLMSFAVLLNASRSKLICTVESCGDLDGRLETANDYRLDPRCRDNIIFKYLAGDVVKRMACVRSSIFFNKRRFGIKIFAIIIALMLLLLITTFDLGLVIPSSSIISGVLPGNESGSAGDGGTGGSGGSGGGAIGHITEEGITGGANKNIFGNATVVNIEGENVTMEVHPEYGGEISIGEEDDVQRVDDFYKYNLNRDVRAQSALDTYSENIAQDEEDIIRYYFEKVVEEEEK